MAKKLHAAAKADHQSLDLITVEVQRRKQIIEAARACITAEGVDKLTLRKVGERAGVSHTTIAYYFNTRQELVDSALREISAEFMIGLRERQPFYGTDYLVYLIDVFLDAERPGSRFVVQMIDAGIHDADLRAIHDEFVAYGRDRIEKAIRLGVGVGALRSDVDLGLPRFGGRVAARQRWFGGGALFSNSAGLR